MASPTFIEVCAGCGGLSTGFIEAGWTPLLLNEIDKSCIDTLGLNHPGVPIDQGDMIKLKLSDYKGSVDMLMGGVPCQSWSHNGDRKGFEDPRGKLILEFNRLVLDCEPKMFMVENVKGLLTHNKGTTFKSIVELFENQGKYRVYYRVLNAVDYGVPQRRERVLIVGVRDDVDDERAEFCYPEKSGERVVLRDVLIDVPSSPGLTYSDDKKKVLDLVPQGGCWVDLPDDVKKAYMGASLESGGGNRGIAKRLAMDEPCLTLTASPCQKQTERCHPLETRPLTVREYARIQSFPDSYAFAGGARNQYKQIGNAVPVKLAHAMAVAAGRYLRG